MNDRFPRYNTPETTILILRDCPYAKGVLYQSLGILPLSFFQTHLQSWLQTNATSDRVILHQQLPWNVYFPFLCWHLWLARNKCIFKNQSRSQHRLVHKTVQATIEFFFYLACPVKIVKNSISQIIKWITPIEPFIKLNTDGSSSDNLGMAEAGGLLRDSSGLWISRFSLSMDITTNNMAELGAVRQGLILAWDLEFKFIQLEIDSMRALFWLTTTTANFPPNAFPLEHSQ